MKTMTDEEFVETLQGAEVDAQMSHYKAIERAAMLWLYETATDEQRLEAISKAIGKQVASKAQPLN